MSLDLRKGIIQFGLIFSLIILIISCDNRTPSSERLPLRYSADSQRIYLLKDTLLEINMPPQFSLIDVKTKQRLLPGATGSIFMDFEVEIINDSVIKIFGLGNMFSIHSDTSQIQKLFVYNLLLEENNYSLELDTSFNELTKIDSTILNVILSNSTDPFYDSIIMSSSNDELANSINSFCRFEDLVLLGIYSGFDECIDIQNNIGELDLGGAGLETYWHTMSLLYHMGYTLINDSLEYNIKEDIQGNYKKIRPARYLIKPKE